MSHIAQVDVLVKDLPALKAACVEIGLEFMEGQQAYKWFGRSVGDWPIPQGYSAEELGKCLHAIRVPGKPNAYEIGVVARRDGQPGYSLLWDFYHGGYGLQDLVGQDCKKLRQAYSTEVAKRQLLSKGYNVAKQKMPNGQIRLVATKN